MANEQGFYFAAADANHLEERLMKAPREYRRWVAKLRACLAGKNGVIPNYAWDNPRMERMFANHKRLKSRALLIQHGAGPEDL